MTHVWCQASTRKASVDRRRRLGENAARLQSAQVLSASEVQAHARVGAKRGALARQGHGPTRPCRAITIPTRLCTGNYKSSLLCVCVNRSGPPSPPKRLVIHETRCSTDSQDAWRSKSRGIVLRVHKTPANTMTPQKPLFAAQRDASRAARRHWVGEAAQTWDLYLASYGITRQSGFRGHS